jgi:hypothetical protein
MNIVSLFITKEGENDEIVQFKEWSVPNMYEVTYTPSDLANTKYRFHLDREGCEEYIYNLLKMLSLDAKPFHEIQVSTRTMPSVVFEIPDLSNTHIRELIEDSVLSALDASPRTVRTE